MSIEIYLKSFLGVRWGGGGGGVQIGKFQRGDNSCIGHHSFKCVFVASCFLALKSENEKLDILVF